eukprot:1138134-Pelagomonas_calceolata.AAC.6
MLCTLHPLTCQSRLAATLRLPDLLDLLESTLPLASDNTNSGQAQHSNTISGCSGDGVSGKEVQSLAGQLCAALLSLAGNVLGVEEGPASSASSKGIQKLLACPLDLSHVGTMLRFNVASVQQAETVISSSINNRSSIINDCSSSGSSSSSSSSSNMYISANHVYIGVCVYRWSSHRGAGGSAKAAPAHARLAACPCPCLGPARNQRGRPGESMGVLCACVLSCEYGSLCDLPVGGLFSSAAAVECLGLLCLGSQEMLDCREAC